MKKLVIRIVVIALLAVVFIAVGYFLSKKETTEELHISHDMVVYEIEQLGKLEVVKYNIRDMVEYKKVRQWLPNSKTALIVVGEVIGCIDLAKLNKEDVQIFGDSVSLMLPPPEICHFKIDHERSKVYNVEYGLWETSELVDAAYKNAEQQLYQEALKMGIVVDSKDNAVKILNPLLTVLGFKKIHIEFKGSDNSKNKYEHGKIEILKN